MEKTKPFEISYQMFEKAFERVKAVNVKIKKSKSYNHF